MRPRVLVIATVAAAFVIEPTLGARLSILGGRPLLVLAVVVYFALVRGGTAGTLFGWIVGLASDLTSLQPMGVRALSFSLVGCAAGNAWESVYKDNLGTQAVILFLAALLHESVMYLVMSRLDLDSLPGYLLRSGLPVAVLTAVVVPLGLAGLMRASGREISFDAHRLVVRRRR